MERMELLPPLGTLDKTLREVTGVDQATAQTEAL
jgi:hypothetical protein